MNNWFVNHMTCIANSHGEFYNIDNIESLLHDRNKAIRDFESLRKNQRIRNICASMFEDSMELRYNMLKRICYTICWYTNLCGGDVNTIVRRHDDLLRYFGRCISNRSTDDDTRNIEQIIQSFADDSTNLYTGSISQTNLERRIKSKIINPYKKNLQIDLDRQTGKPAASLCTNFPTYPENYNRLIPKQYRNHYFNGMYYVDPKEFENNGNSRTAHHGISKNSCRPNIREVCNTHSPKQNILGVKRNIVSDLDAEIDHHQTENRIVQFRNSTHVQSNKSSKKLNESRERQTTLSQWIEPVDIWFTNKQPVGTPNHHIFTNMKSILKNPLPFHRQLDVLFPTYASRQTYKFYLYRITCFCKLPKRLYKSKSGRYYYGCNKGIYPRSACNFFLWYDEINHGEVILCNCNKLSKKCMWKEKVVYKCCHYKSVTGCNFFKV